MTSTETHRVKAALTGRIRGSRRRRSLELQSGSGPLGYAISTDGTVAHLAYAARLRGCYAPL